jgi:hypothetical protein
MDLSAEEFSGKIHESNWRARADAYSSLKAFISSGDASEDFYTDHGTKEAPHNTTLIHIK